MKIKFLLMAAMLMLVLAISAQAQSVSLESGSLKIGDSNQDRITKAASFSVTYNQGATGPANCTATITTNPFTTSATIESVSNYVKYRTGSTAPLATINPVLVNGTPTTVTIEVAIPKDFDGVDDQLRNIAFKVGQIQVSCAGSSATRDLEVQAVNRLEFKDVDLCISNPNEDSEENCESLDDGDDVENILPGAKLKLDINAENKFSDSDDNGEKIRDIEIRDVEVEWDIDDSDFGDTDDSETLGDISADDEESESFNIDTEDDAPKGTYKLTIDVSGVDENGATHGERFEIDLKVDRRTHDIIVNSLKAQPNEIACLGSRAVSFSYRVTNSGTRDDDDIVVEIANTALNLLQSKSYTELKEDDSKSGTVSVTIPESAVAGTYPFTFRTYYDTDSLSRESVVNVVVAGCEQKDDDEAGTIAPVVQQPPVVQPPIVQPVTNVPRVTPTIKTNVKEEASPWYLIGIILAIVVVIIIIIALIMALVRGKSTEE